jgi:transcription-repair coupling factor (superfamily II helicase)
MLDDPPAPALTLGNDGKLTTVKGFAKRLVAGPVPAFTTLAGVQGSGSAWLCSELLRAGAPVVVLVGADAERAHRAVADTRYHCARSELPVEPVLLLADEGDLYAPTLPDRRASLSRQGALVRLSLGQAPLLVTSATTLLRRLPPADVLRRATVVLEHDGELDVGELRSKLSAAGYAQAPIVEDPGSFAVRGGIVDVWPADGAAPARAELFGDTVSSLQEFDPDTQRTRKKVGRVVLAPARDAILSEPLRKTAETRLRELCDQHGYPSLKTRQLVEDVTLGRQGFGATAYLPAFYDLVGLFEYLPRGAILVFEDPTTCKQRLQEELRRLESLDVGALAQPHFPKERLVLGEDELEEALGRAVIVAAVGTAVLGRAGKSVLERLDTASQEPESLGQSDHGELTRAVQQARAATGKGAALDPLVSALERWHEEGLRVECVTRANAQANRLAMLLRHRDVAVKLGTRTTDDDDDLDAGLGEATSRDDALLEVRVGTLERGVVSPSEGLVLLTEEEIFGHKVHAQRKRKTRALAPLEDLRALAIGDYVIHSEHGIGRYLGLENRVVAGAGHVELLVVEYLGGKLYLPVYRLNQIEKHSGEGKLDRLGGTTFAKTKAKARAKAREMADELLRLYAERNAVERPPLPAPDDEYAAFEAAFPYEETTDQANAIQDVQQDLSEERVMDRLVCGDVGFGKTEVALRAAFRAVSAGMQVAVLCPTTVLAQQHFLTFEKRLANHPFVVRVLSRFENKKEAAETLQGITNGRVDIVVGTHRMLSKDVQFKNLGLVVIDEEQRFGVVHKERLKKLRTQVDVLTLTATPIPRTLQLAMGGLRQVSYISTPPRDRRSIRTVVARFDETIVKEAIERELARGGQVYYVYNRVEGLVERAARLQTLLPSARIAIGHGQMRETLLEKAMLGFVDGEFDVLVSTAIVESGLDIPRANTMIIDRADLFGLAQLYQLRGRVGRSELRAYCYLLVPAPSEMTDEARSRIEALERYTELGSGFRIAALDMELRGAGDLLGADQSGVLQSVGLELFCHMLEEATAELRGETVVHDIDPELNFDVEALLPADYIEEVGLRLSLYKRLASAESENEVTQLAAEMEDRFGPAPGDAVRFVELMRLKTELRRLKVLVCEATKGSVSLRFRADTPLDARLLAELVGTERAKFKLAPDGRLTRKARETEQHLGSIGLAAKLLEELVRAER